MPSIHLPPLWHGFGRQLFSSVWETIRVFFRVKRHRWIEKHWTIKIILMSSVWHMEFSNRPNTRSWCFFPCMHQGNLYFLKPLCVCVSVCDRATGHSFWPRDLIFWHNTPWDMRKKRNFLFFEILIFCPLMVLFRPFSSIFFFILCKSSVRATSHTDWLTNLIFGTESLYGTIT